MQCIIFCVPSNNVQKINNHHFIKKCIIAHRLLNCYFFLILFCSYTLMLLLPFLLQVSVTHRDLWNCRCQRLERREYLFQKKYSFTTLVSNLGILCLTCLIENFLLLQTKRHFFQKKFYYLLCVDVSFYHLESLSHTHKSGNYLTKFSKSCIKCFLALWMPCPACFSAPTKLIQMTGLLSNLMMNRQLKNYLASHYDIREKEDALIPSNCYSSKYCQNWKRKFWNLHKFIYHDNKLVNYFSWTMAIYLARICRAHLQYILMHCGLNFWYFKNLDLFVYTKTCSKRNPFREQQWPWRLRLNLKNRLVTDII